MKKKLLACCMLLLVCAAFTAPAYAQVPVYCCSCSGKITSISLLYGGSSGVTIKVYGKRNLKDEERIKTFDNVYTGQTLVVTSDESRGFIPPKLYVVIPGGNGGIIEISTNCSA